MLGSGGQRGKRRRRGGAGGRTSFDLPGRLGSRWHRGRDGLPAIEERCILAALAVKGSQTQSRHPSSEPVPHPLPGVIVIKSSLAVVLLFLGACSFTAKAELLPAHADALDSIQLHQKRAIGVFLPKDHEKEPARRYETIYVLDGDWNAKLVVQTVDFLQATGWMPPVIVVSVPNFFDDKGINSRDRDLTPSLQPNEPRSGGAVQFMAFLKSELIPYVNQHYPGNGVN